MSELLRFATAGSVDDGKSTLIGRLLYDSKAIFEDQLEAIELTSRRRGEEYTNLALLTDGLRAEREQGITIDVAYRYFATPRRKFIIADTPGHTHYTRNMVTGASTADLALILIDARKGVLEQSRRHAFLASLLRVPHLVLCVNKMDLVDYDQSVYERIREEFAAFATRLEVSDLTFVPVSALNGDNVVNRSPNMPWYEGPPLLHHLEEVHIASDRNLIDNRFAVQYVIRPMSGAEGLHDYRGYAGTVAGGVFRPGDDVLVLPSGRTSTITSIDTMDGPRDEAFPPMSVTLRLADDIDISRGDLICRPHNQPHVSQNVDAMVCWFDETSSLSTDRTYAIKHTSRWVRGQFRRLHYRLDVNTLHRDQEAPTLELNEIGRVSLHTTSPLLFEDSRRSRSTGSFIVVDEHTNLTVAGGMIIGADRPAPVTASRATNVTYHAGRISREERWRALGVGGATVWLTGLSGSGKSTIATVAEQLLVQQGRPAYVLDGDNLRHGLNANLGFSDDDRTENVRRVAEVARLFAESGVGVLVSLISPFRTGRDHARAIHAAAGVPFHEVFVDVPLEECERRDPKGLYAKARAGEIPDMTGITSPYEAPLHPELVLHDEPLEESVRKVIDLLRTRS